MFIFILSNSCWFFDTETPHSRWWFLNKVFHKLLSVRDVNNNIGIEIYVSFRTRVLCTKKTAHEWEIDVPPDPGGFWSSRVMDVSDMKWIRRNRGCYRNVPFSFLRKQHIVDYTILCNNMCVVLVELSASAADVKKCKFFVFFFCRVFGEINDPSFSVLLSRLIPFSDTFLLSTSADDGIFLFTFSVDYKRCLRSVTFKIFR